MSDDSIRAAQTFKDMTDEEAAEWLAAGDYTAVSGIPLTEEVSRRIADLASECEVAGFSGQLNPLGPVQTPTPKAAAGTKGTGLPQRLYQTCCKGTHIPEVTIE